MIESLLNAKLTKALRVPLLLLNLVNLHRTLACIYYINDVFEGAGNVVALVTETTAHR